MIGRWFFLETTPFHKVVNVLRTWTSIELHWKRYFDEGRKFLFTSFFTGATQLASQSWLFIPSGNALRHLGDRPPAQHTIIIVPQKARGGWLMPQPVKRHLWKVKPMREYLEHQDMKIVKTLLLFLGKIWRTLFTKMHCKQNCLRCGLAFQKEPAETWNYQTCKRQQNIMHPIVPLCSSAVALAACRCAQHEPWQFIRSDNFWPKRKVRQCTWTKRFIVPQSRPLQSSCQTRINHHVIEIPKNGYLASPKLTVLKWAISVIFIRGEHLNFVGNPSLIMVRNHSIPWPRQTFHHTMRCL